MGRWLKRLETMGRDGPTAVPVRPDDAGPLAERADGGDDDAGVAWRAAAMRSKVPPHGPIGFLHARELPAGAVPPGACPSCGEPKEPGQIYACRPCVAAKWLVLAELKTARGRVRPPHG